MPRVLAAISSWMSPALQREASAEDIWQETLWIAWRDRERHDWRGVRAFRAWLLGISRNRVRTLAEYITAQKRGGGDVTLRLGSSGGSSGFLMPFGSTTPSRVAWHGERAAMIRAALAEVPENLERVVRLRLLEELPMQEVADRLGIGLSTAKKHFAVGAALYAVKLEKIETDTGWIRS